MAFTRRLCLPLDREPEVAALLDRQAPELPPGEVVTFWWEGTAG